MNFQPIKYKMKILGRGERKESEREQEEREVERIVTIFICHVTKIKHQLSCSTSRFLPLTSCLSLLTSLLSISTQVRGKKHETINLHILSFIVTCL
jgi:hypothetical protein